MTAAQMCLLVAFIYLSHEMEPRSRERWAIFFMIASVAFWVFSK